ncbi:hypothetical protein GGS21DRAFT_236955 [Xylaria nigripes]|nr:hypothetical protein GGS21DRAFT_236955 [Xylaria nigripes]
MMASPCSAMGTTWSTALFINVLAGECNCKLLSATNASYDLPDRIDQEFQRCDAFSKKEIFSVCHLCRDSLHILMASYQRSVNTVPNRVGRVRSCMRRLPQNGRVVPPFKSMAILAVRGPQGRGFFEIIWDLERELLDLWNFGCGVGQQRKVHS